MNQSVRYLLMAISVLGAGALAASCGSQASSELELAELTAELRRAGELATPDTDGVEALAEDETDPSSGCDCGPLISRAPPSCEQARWFCNALGHCGCTLPSASLSLGTVPTGAVLSALAAREASPTATVTAREVRQSFRMPDLPLSDDDEPECKCLGATVSPPQGGCALVDWFCNASGLCRCRS